MEKTDSLIKGNIRRVLTLSLRKTLDDRMKNHLKMGWPEMSCREFEKECIELERAREERREEMAKSTKAKVNQPPPRRHVRQARINAVYEDSELSSDEDLTITDSSDEEIDEEALHWVNRMEQVKKHYVNRGKNQAVLHAWKPPSSHKPQATWVNMRDLFRFVIVNTMLLTPVLAGL